MPKLSVLMPVYNSEKFLAEAIDSILAQTFTDFEFLIIDDGSTDNSIAIIESYHDPRIKLFRNEKNLGITPTLNKGISLATTNFIARMDADDISYPERLEKQYTYLAENPDCGMVSCTTRVISEDGKLVRIDQFKSEHYYYNLTFICWIYHPTVMYRKGALEAVNNYTADYSEDFEIFWQISRQFRIYNLPEVLFDYRVTNQSLCQVLKKQEYEQTQQEQVLRNLRYFAGNSYQLPESFIECYRHNFTPLLSEQNFKLLVNCIKELDYITKKILTTENVNYNKEAIKKAAFHKKQFILAYLIQHLPTYNAILLLLKTVPFIKLLRTFKFYLQPKKY